MTTVSKQNCYHRTVDMFLQALRVERGAAPNTIGAYSADLRQFQKFLSQNHLNPINLDKATAEDCIAYMRHLKGCTITTQMRKLTALRQYYKYLLEERHRDDNPTQILQRPKPRQPLPKDMKIDHVWRLLQAAQQQYMDARNTPKAGVYARTYSLIELIYGSGLRVSEAVSLPLSAVQRTNESIIYVHGKGNKSRMVPTNASLWRSITCWKQYRNAAANHQDSAYLYPHHQDAQRHFTRQAFGVALKKMADRAGLDSAAISPHTLRHAFASHLVDGGADLRSVQVMLGHADIATTQIYTRLANDHLRHVVADLHPLSKDSVINNQQAHTDSNPTDGS